jgi:hypothetical protein
MDGAGTASYLLKSILRNSPIPNIEHFRDSKSVDEIGAAG